MKKSMFRSMLAGCGFALAAGLGMTVTGGAAQAQEAVFVMGTNEVGAPSYNPITSGFLNVVNTLIYDTLIVQDADQSFHPGLADSWQNSDDGMTWIFKLHSGVTFHDGEKFNAETVKWFILKYFGTDNEYMVDAIEKVEVVDELTVRFVMKRPEPNLLFNLSSVFMGIPSPKAYQELGDDYGVTGAVGTGPFKLESFAVGQETVLVRNDDYRWGSALSENKGPAKIARLTFREIPEQSTAFLELKTGGVDMLLALPTDYLSELKNEANVAITSLPGLDVMYMPINTTVEPFTDVKVREATALAVNQKEILDSIYGGVGMEAHNFLISALPESKVEPSLEITYDPERAKQVLDEDGWVVGADGIREKDGKRLEVKLWTQSDTEFKRVTEAVQAQLKAIGMQADITVFDSSTIREQYKKNEHQLAVRSYSWNNADILDWFFSGQRLGYPNISMWNDPKSEEFNVKAMTQSRTLDERIANFKAYHEYLLSQFVFVPIYQPVQNLAYNKTRLKLPATIRGTQYVGQSIMDTEVIE